MKSFGHRESRLWSNGTYVLGMLRHRPIVQPHDIVLRCIYLCPQKITTISAWMSILESVFMDTYASGSKSGLGP